MTTMAARHWASFGEFTFVAGIRLLLALDRHCGRLPFRLVLWPVLAWYLLTRPAARRASRQYLDRVEAALGALGHPPGWRDVWWHFRAFGETLLDKLLAAGGHYAFDRVAIDADPALLRGRGGVIVTAHVGCLELSQALGERLPGFALKILAHTRHAARFNSLLQSQRHGAQVELLQVTEVNAATAVHLGEFVAAGGWIAIAGDRVPVQASKTVVLPFLGVSAPLPVGAYVLASLWRCPLVFLACVRDGRRHRLVLRLLAEQVELPRRDRATSLGTCAAGFVGELEAVLRVAPFEWFNFFDFWGQPTGTPIAPPLPCGDAT